ncbi:hypothetical protein QL285_060941 [Trifolium repens]|nr:hypothetical protein QL285_060941 [Trifolium repens]
MTRRYDKTTTSVNTECLHTSPFRARQDNYQDQEKPQPNTTSTNHHCQTPSNKPHQNQEHLITTHHHHHSFTTPPPPKQSTSPPPLPFTTSAPPKHHKHQHQRPHPTSRIEPKPPPPPEETNIFAKNIKAPPNPKQNSNPPAKRGSSRHDGTERKGRTMMRSVTSQHPNGHKTPQNQAKHQNPNTYRTKTQKNAFYPRHRPRKRPGKRRRRRIETVMQREEYKKKSTKKKELKYLKDT